MQKANEVPKLCHVIEQKLSLPDEEEQSTLRNFMTSEEFLKWVVYGVGITLNENQKKVSVEYLDSSGIVSNTTLIIPFYYCDIDCESWFSNLSSTALVVSQCHRSTTSSALLPVRHALSKIRRSVVERHRFGFESI